MEFPTVIDTCDTWSIDPSIDPWVLSQLQQLDVGLW